MSTPTPSKPSLRSHIADVLAIVDADENWDGRDYIAIMADALLADPTLRAIIDHAARFDWLGDVENPIEAEWRALLATWRAER